MTNVAESVPVSIADLLTIACDRIAPTWPLDQFIAVNPYWGWRGRNITDAAAALSVLAGTELTMPRSWFRSERAAGRIDDHQIDAVATLAGDVGLADLVRAVLDQPSGVGGQGHDDTRAGHHRAALITDLCDAGSGPRRGQTWTNLVIHQISQHCAAHFDHEQGSWHPSPEGCLFSSWQNLLATDHGIPWRRGKSWARSQLALLEDDPNAAISSMLDALGIPGAGRTAYLTSLLLSVNGWAAWCAFNRFQAGLSGGDNDDIVDLAAIRLAWEWLLLGDDDGLVGSSLLADWAASWTDVPSRSAAVAADQQVDWLLQAAAERTYQADIITGLAHAPMVAIEPPAVQAVFCLDVRSERFRRSLESMSPTVQTRGFAGFFGMPISYTPVGSALTRPQLPGLLSPALNVTERSISSAGAAGTDGPAEARAALAAQRSARLDRRERWDLFRSAPSSVFTFVESTGLIYGPKLVEHSLANDHSAPRWENEGLSKRSIDSLRVGLDLVDDDPAAAAAIAHGVLRTMGLSSGFAPIVLICGHGSHTTNNPHAAGLDCGACGGQPGDVNARVFADLLNDPTVRQHLATLGIDVPATTWFAPAIHNTTTDQVTIFDTDGAPEALLPALDQLRQWLEAAGERTRAERSASLGLGHLADRPKQLKRAILERANDWSQVRPEWGLAGNASFIIAPRQRSRHMDLGGRTFLQDYDWTLDADASVLTAIMTAPMIVANWISTQYNASTVDNQRYGSGNKVLHNVVGGRIGVFEGNGGDLRIGLAEQSLHDGRELFHRPLRLSVFIEAARASLDSVIADQPIVHDLIANGWLHLLRIDPESGAVERWASGGWLTA
ncbi:MAG: DUF2309 domain-containing protein [Ilumatobacteraceae bacterium]